MIRLGIRNNLFYPGMLIISSLFRQIDSIIMKEAIGFEGISLLLTLIMFFSEFISGLIFFKINNNFLSKYEKKNTEFEYMKIKLIQEEYEIQQPDNSFKIIFLLFLISFYDFMEFEIDTYFLPKYYKISDSLVFRLRNLVTISSSLLCYYLFKFPLYRHHKCSLLIIFICLILIIVLEYLENLERDFFLLLKVIAIIIMKHFFNSFKDVIEKYILEYDNVNCFKALMFEGLFGFILAFVDFIEGNPFDKIKDFFKENKNETIKIVGLLVCLIFYFLLSGAKNIYRIITNKLFSPITKGSADTMLDPILIVLYFSDFKNNFHFIYNLILSFIMDFWVCVYNELFVLYFCKMEHDTYIAVSMRAKINEILNEDNNSDSDD